MKKKLVAFAVTAAMLVTSAVPALAWEPAGSVEMPSANAVELSYDNDLSAGIKNTYNETIRDGASWDVNVDMLRTTGFWEMDLTLRGTEGDLYHYKANFDANGVWKYGDSSDDAVHKVAQSITTFSWEVDKTNGFVFLNVDEKGTSAQVEDYLRWDLGSVEPVTVVSLELRPWADASNDKYSTVVYQDAVPTRVVDATIVKADNNGEILKDKYDHEQVVTQLTKDENYLVKDITFDDGTVVPYDQIVDYATLTWKATDKNGVTSEINGTGVTNFDGRFLTTTEEKLEGCYITLEVTGKEGTGIFGTYTWGDGMESIAIFDRLAGENRYETAMMVADQMKPAAGGFDTIFVATGTNYADALSVTALANKLDAPILLVNGAYEDEVKAYIDENSAGYYDATTVYIVGGTSAVSADFEDSLGQYNVNVERIAGDNRYDTNLKVLQAYREEGGKDLRTMLVASGTNFPDALSAAATGEPVLLVGDELTRSQRSYLNSLSSNKRVYDIIGGRNAVSNDIREELSETKLYNATVTRTGGADRYETNMMVMEKYNKNGVLSMGTARYAFVATGNDYADALTGGVLAAQNGAPLILVNQNNIDAAQDTIDAVKASPNYVGLVVIGGVNAVSNELVQKIA